MSYGRYDPYSASDSRYGSSYGGGGAYGGASAYGGGGYGGGYGGGGYGGGGGFSGGRGGRRDLDSMTLSKPDFSNLPKFEKNFYLVRDRHPTATRSAVCTPCLPACWSCLLHCTAQHASCAAAAVCWADPWIARAFCAPSSCHTTCLLPHTTGRPPP